MDNQKPLLFAALTFILFLIWQAWQNDYNKPSPVAQSEVSQTQASQQTTSPDVPTAQTAVTSEPVQIIGQTATSASNNRIRIRTDVYDIEVDTKGASIRKLALLNYPVEKKKPEVVVHLLDDQGQKFFITQSGFLASNNQAPNHLSQWQTEAADYQMKSGEQTLQVPFTWSNGEGITVTKVLTFTRGSYEVKESFTVENSSDQIWTGRPYAQLQRNDFTGTKKNSFIYTYTGAVLYTNEDKYEKISFDDIEDQDLSQDAVGGWSAMIQHYFVAAWIPPAGESYHYYTKTPETGRYVIGAYGNTQKAINPGDSAQFENKLFAGPKLQDHLAEVAPGLELTVDYGKLTILAEPVFWLLDLFHSWVGNWGFAIIMVTMLIKLLFYGLSEKSYRSMAQMRKMQPRIMAMKERYGDDKQKLNQAMMDLYKTEKINPLGGCLPILVQIPVFISLYWVLLESVEMRQAPFILWMNNLSEADPYFILPLLMGVSMFIQQKLNPAPVDPMQQKIMSMLPIIFTLFFAYFPSGLVLYWVVNNVLSITQQYVITKRVEAGEIT